MEVCHRAIRIVIRESIEKESESADNNEEVPEITQIHFSKSLELARKSLTNEDIRIYEQFNEYHIDTNVKSI